MPRTRFAWHLFVLWCALAAAVVVVCQWLASVELARLADAMQVRRMADVGATLVALLRADGDDAEFAAAAREMERAGGLSIDRFGADGQPSMAGARDGAEERSDGGTGAGTTLDPSAVEEAIDGRASNSSRYDAGAGRRMVSVAVPVMREGRTRAIIRVSAPSADASLSAGQRRLLVGGAATAITALILGWLLARGAARPVEEISRAASRLADGETATVLPASDVGEVAAIAEAVGRLRRQLEERGRTIGRQGTQQEAVLGSMIEGVLAVDARQRILSLNRAAADLLGIDTSGVLGRPIQEVVRNADLRRFALEAIDRGDQVEEDILLRAARDRIIRVRGTPLRDPSGEGGAVMVVEDITDIRHLENVRRDFVANVSHELKTPVASIKGFVETLLEDRVEDPDDRRRFLEIVGRQADRLGMIIEDLLALSRIEEVEGVGNLPVEEARVADLLEVVATECGPRAQPRSIRIETECPADLRAAVNSPLLEQALINLVDNAIKYSDPGSPVRVSGSATDGTVELSVRDEGAGIAAEHLPRLFERFYRVDKGRSRKLGGTGLGLSIVKHIVQAHGGTVSVDSAPGLGSTFRIVLPVRRVPPTGDA